MGEPFRSNTNLLNEDDLLDWSEELALVEQCLEAILLKKLPSDDVIGGAPPYTKSMDSILVKAFNLVLDSSPLLPTTSPYV